MVLVVLDRPEDRRVRAGFSLPAGAWQRALGFVAQTQNGTGQAFCVRIQGPPRLKVGVGDC